MHNTSMMKEIKTFSEIIRDYGDHAKKRELKEIIFNSIFKMMMPVLLISLPLSLLIWICRTYNLSEIEMNVLSLLIKGTSLLLMALSFRLLFFIAFHKLFCFSCMIDVMEMKCENKLYFIKKLKINEEIFEGNIRITPKEFEKIQKNKKIIAGANSLDKNCLLIL